MVPLLLCAAVCGAAAGEVEVRVVSATVGRAVLADRSFSAKPVLKVSLEIRNASESEQAHYRGWPLKENDTAGDFRARLQDDLGRTLKPVLFGAVKPAGELGEKILEPGESAREILLFEMPQEDARELHLVLPGRQIGLRADFHLGIINPMRADLLDAQPQTPNKSAIARPVTRPPAPAVPKADPVKRRSEAPEAGPPAAPARKRSPPTGHGFVAFGLLLWFFVVLVGGSLYFLPVLIALARSHHNMASILVVNLLLGWTMVGWAAALAMSVSYVDPFELARRRQVRRDGEERLIEWEE